LDCNLSCCPRTSQRHTRGTSHMASQSFLMNNVTILSHPTLWTSMTRSL
jgi:hypothetical protein